MENGQLGSGAVDSGNAGFEIALYHLDGSEKVLGTIQGQYAGIAGGSDYGVSVFLTEKQKVFPPVASDYLRLRGPWVRGHRYVGKFVPRMPGGREFDAVLTLFPNSVVFDGIIDGKFRSNIFSWSYSIFGPG